jgi:hypothetical protein
LTIGEASLIYCLYCLRESNERIFTVDEAFGFADMLGMASLACPRTSGDPASSACLDSYRDADAPDFLADSTCLPKAGVRLHLPRPSRLNLLTRPASRLTSSARLFFPFHQGVLYAEFNTR